MSNILKVYQIIINVEIDTLLYLLNFKAEQKRYLFCIVAVTLCSISLYIFNRDAQPYHLFLGYVK